jgi:transcriptional regulator with XRE-family HTH domain
MKFGKVLKRLRKERGLLQREVGVGAGVDNTLVSYLETNKRTPSFKTLANYSTLFDIPVWEIVREAEES